MVSKRSIVAAISLTIIILLILSFIWPLLFQPPIPRQEEYDDVPDWGTGVTVGTDDSFLDNITLDDVPLDLNWSLDPSFTVAVISPVDPPRYWRNTAYDRYTGTNWEKSSNATHLLDAVTPGAEIVYTIVQNITHQVAGSFPLLSLWPDPMIISNSIQCPHLPYPDSYDLETDQYGTAILNGRFSGTGNTTLEYQVTYDPLNWTTIRPQSQSAGLTPAAILTQYQQQGLNQLSSATRTYIQSELSSILAGVPDNAFEEAFAILNYFKSTFTFDPLVPRPGASDEHVAWFLAQGAGIGLDFATAYTMFLRESGIAARPVVGAVLGTNNGSHRILHLMHVHFWVEVYVPTSSVEGYWLQFDPTPLPSIITDGSPPPTPSIKKPPDPGAMDQDPYVISTYYDLSVSVMPPVVDRAWPFQIMAILTRDGAPEPGELLMFYDDTENWLLGSNVTTATGEASITFQYNYSAIVGFHLLRVAFHAQSEYAGIALHGAANLSLSLTPQEVNRTTSVHFNGTLIDAVNGRGISYNETGLTGVSILLNNILIIEPWTDAFGRYSVDYIISASQAPLGLTAVNATFGILGIIDPTNSTIETLNITATSQLSVQAIPNSIRSNSTATIQGQLQYENGTGIAGQPVQLLWNGTPLGSAITDSAGYYALNHTPIPIGYVTIEAQFIGAPLVYGSNTRNTARVHEEGAIIIFVDDEDGDDLTQRGRNVYFSGWVENQNGTRQGFVTVRIFINGSEIAQTTTLANGSFFYTYQLDPTQSVGAKEVTGDIIHGTLVVVSSFDYFAINSTTQIQNLSFDISPAMLGELLTLTGQIIDDQSLGLSGQLSISLSYLTTTIPLGTILSQPSGMFSYSFIVPLSIPGSISNVTFDISYLGTTYFGPSSDSEFLGVFSNATLLIDVSSGPFAWNASIPINGTLVDSFGRALTNRDIQLFIDNTYNFTAVSNQYGQVYFVLRLRPSGNTDVNYTLQLRHETIITVNSTVRIITVEAQEQMQTPPPIYFPIELAMAIIVVLVIIVVVILGYRYWKRRPRQPTAPSIDAAAMLTALRQLLTQQKYRESIIYAFRMFEAIVQAKLGVYRDPSITVREFANITVAHGRLDTRNMEVFIRGVEEARYSDHPISYNTALSTLNAFAKMYNSLTGGNLRFVTQEQQPATEPERTESG